jgi:hypothetical protein
VCIFRRLVGVLVGQVDERREVALKLMRPRLVPSLEPIGFGDLVVGQRFVRHLQSAAETQHAVVVGPGNAVQIRRGTLHVDVAPADPRVHRLRLQQPDQVLEIAGVAGAEVPTVVIRQAVPRQVRALRMRLPCAAHRIVHFRQVEGQAGDTSGLERRHQERVIRLVWLELPRTDEPRIREVRVLAEHGVEASGDGGAVAADDLGLVRPEIPIDVHVRPRPQLFFRGEHRQISDVDEGERLACRVAVGELTLLEHHQRNPRPVPVRCPIRARRGVAPRKVFVVELDVREVIRLEIGDPVFRLGFDDGSALDADDVARTEQADRARNRHVRDRGADALDVQHHLDVHVRSQRWVRGGLVLRDAIAQPLPEPRKKRVGREWMRHRVRLLPMQELRAASRRPMDCPSPRASCSRALQARCQT